MCCSYRREMGWLRTVSQSRRYTARGRLARRRSTDDNSRWRDLTSRSVLHLTRDWRTLAADGDKLHIFSSSFMDMLPMRAQPHRCMIWGARQTAIMSHESCRVLSPRMYSYTTVNRCIPIAQVNNFTRARWTGRGGRVGPPRENETTWDVHAEGGEWRKEVEHSDKKLIAKYILSVQPSRSILSPI